MSLASLPVAENELETYPTILMYNLLVDTDCTSSVRVGLKSERHVVKSAIASRLVLLVSTALYCGIIFLETAS